MAMRPSDQLVGPVRGDAETAIAYAERVGAKRLGDVVQYVEQVYRTAQEIGLDPSEVVAQSVHDTNAWRSPAWAERLVAAGQGITDGPDHGFRWANGDESALGHLHHLGLYVGVAVLPWQPFNPGWEAPVAKGYFGIATTIDDLTGRWGTDPEYGIKIARRGNEVFPGLPNQEDVVGGQRARLDLWPNGQHTRPKGDTGMANMTKGLIPLPRHQKRFISKPRGVGWNDYGQRPARPPRTRWHRMQGTLWGTDGYFRRATVNALTDAGMDHQTGECIIWIPFWDTRITPYASGPVNVPYGDAACNLANHPQPSLGVHLANWGGVSLELGGYFRQPGTAVTQDSLWSEVSQRRWAQFVASLAHDGGIEWSTFPLDNDGCSVITWHEEWIGKPGAGVPATSKHCPGDVVMAATGNVIQLAQDLMRAAQTASATPPAPRPGLAYPEGMDKGIAARAFGKIERDGVVYQFDERGPVSRLWLDLAWTRKPEDALPLFPTIEDVWLYKDGATTRYYYRFENGLMLWKPNARAAVEVLGDN